MSNVSNTADDGVSIWSGPNPSYIDMDTYYEHLLKNMPQEVIKEYYLKHFTKLGRKLSGEE